MAYLELNNGKKSVVSRKQGEFLWKSLHDPSSLDDAQLDKLRKIKAVYLNWHSASADYIAEHLKTIVPMALNDWAVNRAGKPVRPGSDEAWKFAKRWGLWENGGPTLLVTEGVTLPTQTTLAGSLAVDD